MVEVIWPGAPPPRLIFAGGRGCVSRVTVPCGGGVVLGGLGHPSAEQACPPPVLAGDAQAGMGLVSGQGRWSAV